MSDVKDFVEDHENEGRLEASKLNKGLRKMILSGRDRVIDYALDHERRRLERQDARREIPITLPKLKFMSEE